MLKNITYVFLLLGLLSCLEPYDVDISNYKDLLVVDALITDEVKNHHVYLSRSVPNLDEEPQLETGALVTITDENDFEEVLTEIEPGVYETDPLQFIARVGGTYVLNIRTRGGVNYQSSPCTIQAKTQIEDVYYKAGKQWSDDETEEWNGIHIMVDGNSHQGGYVRWMYDEDWKFKVPYPHRVEFNYIINDWDFLLPDNVVCWKKDFSNEIVIHSFSNQSNSQIKGKKICFVPSEVTDKLTVRYSILVKQLSISKEEFEFWNKLKMTTKDVGDAFGLQPFSISGNIRNLEDHKEPVLGYFQTGGVETKRMYINRKEISDKDIPIMAYNHNCSLEEFLTDESGYSSTVEMYEELVLAGSFAAFDVIYDDMGFSVIGLKLSRPVCADCTLTATSQRPDFWED